MVFTFRENRGLSSSSLTSLNNLFLFTKWDGYNLFQIVYQILWILHNCINSNPLLTQSQFSFISDQQQPVCVSTEFFLIIPFLESKQQFIYFIITESPIYPQIILQAEIYPGDLIFAFNLVENITFILKRYMTTSLNGEFGRE